MTINGSVTILRNPSEGGGWGSKITIVLKFARGSKIHRKGEGQKFLEYAEGDGVSKIQKNDVT